MHFDPGTVLQLAELLDTEFGLERLLNSIEDLLGPCEYNQLVDVNDHENVIYI